MGSKTLVEAGLVRKYQVGFWVFRERGQRRSQPALPLPVCALACLSLFLVLFFLAGSAEAQAQTTAVTGGSVPCQPVISQDSASPFWASYADYTDRTLSVRETITNGGGCVPCPVDITGVSATGGVSVETPLPIAVGQMAASSSRQITLRFGVPVGVARFTSRITGACQEASAAAGLTLTPRLAYANQGCPAGAVPGLPGLPAGLDESYAPRRFIARLVDENGAPVAGRGVKWSLSNTIDFRITGESDVTDASGEAFADVTPPLYFLAVAPYFSYGVTLVDAREAGGGQADSLFGYTICVPPGETPPWQ